MTIAGFLFAGAAALFCLHYTIVAIERRRGDRLIIASGRRALDRAAEAFLRRLSTWCAFVTRHVFQWSWYLLVDVVLKSVLYVIVKVGDRLEALFYQNRQRTKALRAERSHRSGILAAVAEHKASTALSEAEKQRLRKKSLEGMN